MAGLVLICMYFVIPNLILTKCFVLFYHKNIHHDLVVMSAYEKFSCYAAFLKKIKWGKVFYKNVYEHHL